MKVSGDLRPIQGIWDGVTLSNIEVGRVRKTKKIR